VIKVDRPFQNVGNILKKELYESNDITVIM